MAGLIRSPGTATFTNNSANVTGSGTNWATTVRAGYLIRSKSNNVWYEVLSDPTDTGITLVENWSGTTGSYGFEILPWFGSANDAPTRISADIAQFLALYAALFSVAGNSKTQVLNKATNGSDAGLILQVAGAGHFRIGLFGDTALRVERSADGTNWTTIMAVDRATGAAALAGAFTSSGTFVANGLTSRNGSAGTNGTVVMLPGDSSATGFLEFRAADGTRRGFMGAATSSQIFLAAEAGIRWSISGNVGIGTIGSLNLPLMVGGHAQFGAKAGPGLRYQEVGSAYHITGINHDNNAFNALAISTTSTGGDLVVATSGRVSVRVGLDPATDNTVTLGSGSLRYNTVFAGTGTINTSDQTEKTPLRALTEPERRVALRIFNMVGVFQWLNAVAEKGEDGARLHVGVTAQALREAFEAEGLDAGRYGVWCRDPIMKTVTRKRVVKVEKKETVTTTADVIEIENGVPVLRTVERTEERTVGETMAVVDPKGRPVLDDKGQAITLFVPDMVEIEQTWEEQEPSGEYREGIRPDQLYAFVTAGAAGVLAEQRAEIETLKARLDALAAA